MFVPGPSELLILLVIGALALGVPIVIVVLLVVLLRKNDSSGDAQLIAQLRDENQRLRDELAAARKGE